MTVANILARQTVPSFPTTPYGVSQNGFPMKSHTPRWFPLLVAGLLFALMTSSVIPAPAADTVAEPGNTRPPTNDDELKYWLTNMLVHHQFTSQEVTQATGLTADEIEAATERFAIIADQKPARKADAPLLVLPYPGGRHPRIGFLEGAIHPQRETKVSVFAPWENGGYVVVDVPEAIFTNLGLTYLAHTHIPTIWSEQDIELEKLEWNRRENGNYDVKRQLPNGIEFGAEVTPTHEAVRMTLWFKNGTKEPLTNMRVQNCVMLKGAPGFNEQTNKNKVNHKPYTACRSEDGKRWIIAAWTPCLRAWANERCPCLHSDPLIPDCAPGETETLRGWLSFYEGDDIMAEFDRIEKTGWREE